MEAGAELIPHKHADLCHIVESGWPRCSELPLPGAPPQHLGVSALTNKALEGPRGTASGG